MVVQTTMTAISVYEVDTEFKDNNLTVLFY